MKKKKDHFVLYHDQKKLLQQVAEHSEDKRQNYPGNCSSEELHSYITDLLPKGKMDTVILNSNWWKINLQINQKIKLENILQLQKHEGAVLEFGLI